MGNWDTSSFLRLDLIPVSALAVSTSTFNVTPVVHLQDNKWKTVVFFALMVIKFLARLAWKDVVIGAVIFLEQWRWIRHWYFGTYRLYW